VGKRCVVRHNSVVEACVLPDGFHIPSTTNIHADSDLSMVEQVGFSEKDFSEDVAQTNINLVKGYKKLQNEF
jgi:carbonic anhydrase/acetyltransferase-like protein (isoleucine patch superfamily)